MANEREDATRVNETLGTYTQWAEAFNRKSLRAALKDQALIQRGIMNGASDDARYTPAGRSEQEYTTLRATRDDLDYREWNEETGYSGVTRRPAGPGMVGHGARTEAEKRRAQKRKQLDDGF
ncbi:MAG: hypothetical protein IT385_12820 [Deltaproteobacteria bacterium]|nr:hypothetical protein [Deltaproteobacteria bacterium]